MSTIDPKVLDQMIIEEFAAIYERVARNVLIKLQRAGSLEGSEVQAVIHTAIANQAQRHAKLAKEMFAAERELKMFDPIAKTVLTGTYKASTYLPYDRATEECWETDAEEF